MMLSKYENYLQQKRQQNQPLQQNYDEMMEKPTMDAIEYSPTNFSKAERESIHSGQFMVSHFEAEEAQDDLEECDEVKMLDPEDPELLKPGELANTCTDVQLYVPRNVTHFQEPGSVSGIASHLEIETSLTKLFKCMNLAYSQKLTSPKWNHFKGVRLRWKDKIRLNNVIWRCWHMQFILKRRTPVCQFASPLDVDIHSNPQTVVLEGKYWKRQTTVIKAEYRKWRRNSKSKAAGCLIYDTKSEFDFLEWSPLNDRSLMLPEDWTNDTLFSSINGPFPFPDPREIARGAGIADFMQPGLGSLQPNIDDIDLTLNELLQPTRLPPVPEEGADDMLKNVDYSFSAIMGTEQMDSNNIINLPENTVTNIPVSDDTNMLDLNTPMETMQYAEVIQRYPTQESSASSLMHSHVTNQSIDNSNAILSDQRASNSPTSMSTAMRSHSKHFPTSGEGILNSRSIAIEFPSKSVMKGRISKSSQRPFRREPHNYDKAQPTLHQTTIYQQMLAEQQKNQQQTQHLQPTLNNATLHHQTMTFHPQQQQMQPCSTQFQAQTSALAADGNTTYNNYVNADMTASVNAVPNVNNNLMNVAVGNLKTKNYIINQQQSIMSSTTPNQSILQNVKKEVQPSDVISIFSLGGGNDSFNGNNSISGSNSSINTYKPYPNVGTFKKSSSTGTYVNMRTNNISYLQEQSGIPQNIHAQSLPLKFGCQIPTVSNQMQLHLMSPSSSHHNHQQLQPTQHVLPTTQQMHQGQQSNTSMMPKEMFRSNSLPLNVTLQKIEMRSGHDNFAVPKSHAKSNKPRSRSNSIHQHIIAGIKSNSSSNLMISTQLQSATSDPMLNNSTLAQLLTTNSRKSSMMKKQSSSTSAISNHNVSVPALSMPAVSTSSSISASKPQSVCTDVTSFYVPTQETTMNSATQSETLPRQSIKEQQQKSPKKSTSLPTPTAPHMLHSPPGSGKVLSYPPMAGSVTPVYSNALSLSPDSFHDQDSPLSPTHNSKYPRENQRRFGHIHAEQKRRYNIKNGFDMLHSLIPQLQQNPNAKLSKAAMLQKGAEHIKYLRAERNQLNEHMDSLLKEREILNNSLSHLHSILPANGAPVTRQGTEQVRQLYDQYVRHRTLQNWKFWILGLILEPLLTSYTATVSSASTEELRRTAFLWVDQHCSLIDLRPAVSNKLKYLSMKTDILSDPPSTLQAEVEKAVYNNCGQHPNLHGT